ncbi:2-oxoglutarate dehydrogenase complex dihydrolipoyllysine-residue succinyltransferase [Bacteriovoracaceae bacterium]|nr:2-oxoglutarate dehydrogenase complex dihydrolipoyllysine-residue succinyltransferase [Bacteriovoracaceae bacterium]
MSIIEVKVPSVGESVTEVTLASWGVSDGDIVTEGDIICELESDKATLELPAETSGKLQILSEEGEEYKIGAIIAKIDTSQTASASKAPAKRVTKSEEPVASQSATQKTDKSSVTSPAATKILSEKQIDPSSVNGSGKDGRITKSDALNAQATKVPSTASASQSAEAPVVVTGERTTRREKMSRLRKTIAKRLVEAKNTTAMLTTFNEVDMSAIMEIRKKYKEKFKDKHGVGLGFMSFFTKACCLALKEYPAVGAIIDGEDVIFHDYSDVGIAVSTPKGLVVPVVRSAETLTLADIEKEILRLALKGRDGKLTIDEMQGGNFTITNGGIFGSMLSTPIINIPQSAILGMHNIVQRPMAVNGEVVIKPIMYLALSYDHRIVDGRESVSFLVKIKQILEDPSLIFLDL